MRGAPNDGDDIIDVGNGKMFYHYVYGQGGNDKIIGSIGGGTDALKGGDGDDKIWANNPDEINKKNDYNVILGNNGNDIIYGSAA